MICGTTGDRGLPNGVSPCAGRHAWRNRLFNAVVMIGFMWAVASAPAIANSLPEKLIGHGGPIKAISVAPDGGTALTASFDYTIIHWDISGPRARVVHRMTGHDSAVNDVAFVPGRQEAVSVSDDGTLGIWDLARGVLIARIGSNSHKVLDVSVSSDGRLAAAAHWDATARVFDLVARREVAVLKGHRGNVNASAFSADGTRLYTAAYDGSILAWDVARGTRLRPVYRHGWGINSLERIDDDRLLFGALDGTVAIVSVSGQEDPVVLAVRERPIQSVKISHDGALIAFGDGSGLIEVYRAADGMKVEGAEVTFGPVWDFDFVPGTAQIYHVGLDDFAARWQISPLELKDIASQFPRRFQISDGDDQGELEFQRKCSVCHTLTPDGANRAGPTLYDVFGRRAGTLPGYSYSAALLQSDIVWNEETIARLFDDGPDEVVPGTKMPIQRLKSVSRRDDLIRFLKKATVPVE